MRRIVVAIASAIGLSLAGIAAAPANAIVNGSDAQVNPGAVSIWTENPNRNRCTGVLIHPRYVVTAAHCEFSLLDPAAGTVELRLGSTDNTVGYVSRTMVAMTTHPDVNYATLANDVAVIEMNADVNVNPAKIGPESPIGGLSSPHGWGWICDGPPGLDCSSWYKGKLQKMTAEKLPRTNCVTAVTTNHVCFEHAPGGNTMACLGDSGAGSFTKGAFSNDWHTRFIVLGDGDDWNGTSCTTKLDGTNGYGLGLEIAPYADFIEDVIYGNLAAGTSGSTVTDAPAHAFVG